MQERFAELVKQGRSEYLPMSAGKQDDKAAEAVLEHYRDHEPRHRFYRYVRELQQLYEILSPDPFLRPFLDDYQELVNMYRLVRAAYEPGVSVDKSFLRKTAYLVQQQTQTSVIREVGPDYVLNEQTIDQIAGQHDSDTVKVFNLIKALEQIVQQQSGQSPYLISIGERAEQIVQAFQECQLTTQQTLEQLRQLLAEYQSAERERQETDLSKEGFTVYWLLKREGLGQAEAVAREVTETFKRYPHWRSNDKYEQEVRLAITKALRDKVDCDRLCEHTERILQMLRRSQ